MKRILLSLVLLALTLSSFSQTLLTTGGPRTTVENTGSFKVDSLFGLPVKDTTSWAYYPNFIDSAGRMTFRPNDSEVYFYNGLNWTRFLTSKDASGFIQNQNSTIQPGNFKINGSGILGGYVQAGSTVPPTYNYASFMTPKGYSIDNGNGGNTFGFLGTDGTLEGSLNLWDDNDTGIWQGGITTGRWFYHNYFPYDNTIDSNQYMLYLGNGTKGVGIITLPAAGYDDTGVNLIKHFILPDTSGIFATTKNIKDTAAVIRSIIPTNNNQLVNGAGYITSASIPNFTAPHDTILYYLSTAGQTVFPTLPHSQLRGVFLNNGIIYPGTGNDQFSFDSVSGNVTFVTPTPTRQNVAIQVSINTSANTNNYYDSANTGFIYGKNLLFPSYEVFGSYISSTGTLITNDTAARSTYVPVIATTTYTYSGYQVHPTSSKYLAEYNINDSLLGVVTVLRTSVSTTFTTPVNCAYVRMTYYYDASDSAVSGKLQLELGSSATAYQAPIKTINILNGVHINNADSVFITPSQFPNSLNNTLTFVPGKNLIPPASIVKGKYVSNTGAIITDATASYISNISVTPGITYTYSGIQPHATLSKYLAWYNSSGAFISSVNIIRTATNVTVTAPIGAAFASMTANYDNTDSAVSNALQFELGSVATAYAPYTSSVAAINGIPIQSNSTSATTNNSPAGILTVLKTGNTILIRSSYNKDSDLVQTMSLQNSNFIAGVEGVVLIPRSASITSAGTSLTTSNLLDNVAPTQYSQLGNLGGNHGVETISTVATSHVQDNTDVSSIWSDGTYQYYLTNIVDANNLTFLSLPITIGGETGLRRSIFATPNATLTWVSGGTHHTPISTGTCTVTQNWPSIFNITQRMYVDGFEIDSSVDSTYYCNTFSIESDYSVIDPTKIIATNPFQFNNGQSIDDVHTRFCFARNGSFTYTQSGNYKSFHNVRNKATLQQQGLALPTGTTKMILYIPDVDTLNVGGVHYDLAAKQDMTTPASGYLAYYKSNWQDTTFPPNRVFNLPSSSSGVAQYGNVIGFNINFGGAVPSIRKNNALLGLEISNSANKNYLYLLGNINVDSTTSYYGQMYIAYFDPKVNPLLDGSYAIQQSDGTWIYQIDTHNALNRYILNMPDYLAGKSITILKNNGMTLITNDVVPASGLIFSCSANTKNGNYLTLKLSDN